MNIFHQSKNLIFFEGKNGEIRIENRNGVSINQSEIKGISKVVWKNLNILKQQLKNSFIMHQAGNFHVIGCLKGAGKSKKEEKNEDVKVNVTGGLKDGPIRGGIAGDIRVHVQKPITEDMRVGIFAEHHLVTNSRMQQKYHSSAIGLTVSWDF